MKKTLEETRERRRLEYRNNATAYIRRAKEYKKTKEGKLVERNYFLRAKYGITLDQWNALASNQNNLCAICRDVPIKHTDHCHVTNVVRGLLCHGCNLGLGGFRDNILFLQAAIEYLTISRTKKK